MCICPGNRGFPGTDPRPRGEKSVGSASSGPTTLEWENNLWQTTTRPAVGRSSLSSWEASCSLSSLLPISCMGTRAKLPRSSRQRLKPRHLHRRQRRRQLRNPRQHQRRKPLRRHRRLSPHRLRHLRHRHLKHLRQSSQHLNRSRHLRPILRQGYVWAVLIRIAQTVARPGLKHSIGAPKRRATDKMPAAIFRNALQ